MPASHQTVPIPTPLIATEINVAVQLSIANSLPNGDILTCFHCYVQSKIFLPHLGNQLGMLHHEGSVAGLPYKE